jgi:hypothetical protein
VVYILPEQDCSKNIIASEKNESKNFISINCLEYVTIIINYCAAITALLESQITTNPHPVVLCVTDNTSTKNWTMHTSKKSIIGHALARFFCGLLISSDVSINVKWISTAAIKIVDKISRIKKSANNPSSFKYDFSKLQQDHAESKHCCFFQPSQELLSMIWDILLTQNLPNLSKVLQLKQRSLGRLNI